MDLRRTLGKLFRLIVVGILNAMEWNHNNAMKKPPRDAVGWYNCLKIHRGVKQTLRYCFFCW
jgi:hypothetical protein